MIKREYQTLDVLSVFHLSQKSHTHVTIKNDKMLLQHKQVIFFMLPCGLSIYQSLCIVTSGTSLVAISGDSFPHFPLFPLVVPNAEHNTGHSPWSRFLWRSAVASCQSYSTNSQGFYVCTILLDLSTLRLFSICPGNYSLSRPTNSWRCYFDLSSFIYHCASFR